MVHREDVEQRSGAKVVHVDHSVISNREVFILAEHVTAFVLVLHHILVLETGHRPARFVIDGLFLLVLLLLLVLRDPPPGVETVDQGTQPQSDVRGRHVRPLAGAGAGAGEKH